ncbi:RagB/SusD family nutrient uptake outer membrane protein [Parapedobacter koreensis]|uniref:Starch-binding associating with outer membrane n=1 Tax=Parapedobacter koreensis TaxID=332977 RepID=A0A1H7PDE5_9SPHI|nr:RagB/SusD family nutrient uptake outer membrane protein [Parapedobacter koreensis]SEL33790.1 Starch-binding associating with outer membrane [Parapedobacter koreensis]
MKRYSKLLSIFTLWTMMSCSDILNKVPLDGPADITFLQSTAELSLAVNGVYRNLWYNSLSASGQWEYVLDHSSDIGWDRNLSVFTFAGNGSHSAAEASFSSIWDHLYAGIGRANYILANLDRVADASQETLDLADGQVRFLRSYWYSQLITLWGDVPLVLEPLDIDDNKLPRTAKMEIVDLLLADLDIAADKLPETWGTADRGRATKGAALALKSRIALIGERYDVAAAAANEVIQSGVYALYPDYEKLFSYEGESSSEVIFEIMFQYGIYDHRMPISTFSRNAQGNSTKVPTQSLVDSYECIDGLTIDQSPLYDPAKPFENRDPRLRQTIAVPGDVFLGFQFETHKDSITCWNYNVSPATRIPNQDATNAYASFSGYCWRKTTDPQDGGALRNNSSLNFMVLRLGEVLLNYAEAKIELNELDASCLEAINRIRGRESVQMPSIPAGKSQAEMRAIVRRERKVELALEGLRLQDIRRWKIAEKVMPGPLYGRPQKPYNYEDQGVPVLDQDGVLDYTAYADKLSVIEQRAFNPQRDYLWPIPQSEMDINPNLIQNPNY